MQHARRNLIVGNIISNNGHCTLLILEIDNKEDEVVYETIVNHQECKMTMSFSDLKNWRQEL
jgi:hypothetical protein